MPAIADAWYRIADDLENLPEPWVRSGAELLKVHLLRHVSAATGGDMALSGDGRPITVIPEITGSGDSTAARIAPTPAGPLAWLNYGTRNRPQGGSSPARHVWDNTVSVAIPLIDADLGKRFAAATTL